MEKAKAAKKGNSYFRLGCKKTDKERYSSSAACIPWIGFEFYNFIKVANATVPIPPFLLLLLIFLYSTLILIFPYSTFSIIAFLLLLLIFLYSTFSITAFDFFLVQLFYVSFDRKYIFISYILDKFLF